MRQGLPIGAGWRLLESGHLGDRRVSALHFDLKYFKLLAALWGAVRMVKPF